MTDGNSVKTGMYLSVGRLCGRAVESCSTGMNTSRYSIMVQLVQRNPKFCYEFSQNFEDISLLQYYALRRHIIYIGIQWTRYTIFLQFILCCQNLKSESETSYHFYFLTFWQNLELRGHKNTAASSRKSGIVEPFIHWIFFCRLSSVP